MNGDIATAWIVLALGGVSGTGEIAIVTNVEIITLLVVWNSSFAIVKKLRKDIMISAIKARYLKVK